MTTAALAGNHPDPKESPAAATIAQQGPYCGLYCLYAILKMAGQTIDFADLVRPEYLSSEKGSSAADLIRAAQEHGLQATMVGKLTTRELRASPYPLLLHVKSVEVSKEYDHFVLFLGTQDGKARVLDAPHGQRLLDYPDLVRIWDGVAVLVSTQPIDSASLFTPRRTRLALCGTLLLAAVVSLRWIRGQWAPLRSLSSRPRLLGLSIVQTAGLLVMASIAGIAYHWIDDE
ncbi:MAG: cysteine peptidase family C39 domain-containing protein, partial [Bacillota bacterium]